MNSMKKHINGFLSVLLVITTTTLGSQRTLPQTVDISNIAKQITVEIESSDTGSGVIIQRQDKTYFVLTARHVVKGDNGKTVIIHTFDGLKYSTKSIRDLSSIDLAVLEFSSDKSYKQADIGSSKQGTVVTVAGFPKHGDIGRRHQLVSTPGTVATGFRVPSPEGYDMGYSNETRSGMSGGPILNPSGQLVGIHCTGEGEKTRKSPTDPEEVALIPGWINYGISSNLFVAALQDIGINLASSGSSKEPPTSSAIPNPGSQSQSQSQSQNSGSQSQSQSQNSESQQHTTVCTNSQKSVCDNSGVVNIN